MHFLTQSALLQALGWTLVSSLWQMGLLWLAYWLVTGIFHQSPSRFRHALALAFLLLGALGSVITFADAYFFDDIAWGQGANDGWGVLSAGGWLNGNKWMGMILPYCSSLYLLVLGVLLIRYSHQYLHSRRLGREGLSKIPAELRVFVASTGQLMGIRPKVKAWLSTLVDVPMTVGFWKPVILLPAAMMANLSTQQVEAILIHELAHIRRNDYLLNLGITFIGLVFFFNPFSRLLVRQLQREREHCCDDEVLQFRYDPHAYVSALLSLARQHRQGRLALAATGGGDDHLLLQRARKILQQKRTDRRPGARPFLLLVLTATITILSLSSPARQEQESAARPQQPAAVPANGEMVFIPIVNVGAPKAHTASTHPASGNEPRIAVNPRRPASPKEDGQSAAEQGQKGRDDAPDPLSVTSADVPPSVNGFYTQPAAWTIHTAPVARDNSLGKSESTNDDDDEPAEDAPPMENPVFVPGSSFSYKTVDTLRPEDKLTWMQESTEKEIRLQVTRLQKELDAQRELLRSREAQTRTMTIASQKELKKLLDQQMEIQRDYLRKLDELNIRIRKVSRHRTTVYI